MSSTTTVCNSEFLRATLLQAFHFKFWRTIRYILKSGEFLSLVKFDVWFCDSLVHLSDKINLSTESTLSSVCALRGRPLPSCLIVLPAFLNILHNLLFRPETVQPLPGNSLTSFFAH